MWFALFSCSWEMITHPTSTVWMLREIPVCIALHTVVTRRRQCCCCRMVLTLVSGIRGVNMLVFILFSLCGNVCLRKQNLSETGKNLVVSHMLKLLVLWKISLCNCAVTDVCCWQICSRILEAQYLKGRKNVAHSMHKASVSWDSLLVVILWSGLFGNY